jgi:hypothetical protein
MKYFFGIFTLFLLSLQSSVGATSLEITAIVGNPNHTPVITITSPASLVNPGESEVLESGSNILITLDISDSEMDAMTVSLSATGGSLSKEIVELPEGIENHTVSFRYFTPTIPNNSMQEETITLAVSDGESVRTRLLSVYVYLYN